ncbi:C1q-like domain-containing protein [Siminovitchia fortis]|uniref:C1q domain-containing protein n=1 Tax=Siminovitchia fortis TaxID=254758 RepID=A0A443IWW9_9BACI|nr:hypothetical protein [Siminovitchia fortis]RWR12562.1 hypothetical protein D4N35_005955 [Siminovitchia fortis]WHY81491.1 hypothetical protein QNH23_16695 [Siminovitchia fortis]
MSSRKRRRKGYSKSSPLLAPNVTRGLNRQSIAPTSNEQGDFTVPAAAELDIAQTTSAFRAVRTGPDPLAALTFTKVLYTTERLDINSEYDTATGNFIPQQSGIYSFNASIVFLPSVLGQTYFIELFIRVNGNVIASAFDYFPGNEGYTDVSAIVQLQAGDTVDVITRSGVAGTINNFSTPDRVRFEGVRIS